MKTYHTITNFTGAIDLTVKAEDEADARTKADEQIQEMDEAEFFIALETQFDGIKVREIKKIKESEVLERIGMCIDELDMNDLAELHNDFYSSEKHIIGDDIEPGENLYLIPKKGI